MEPILKVENLSKQYRLGNVGTGTLSHDINRWWHKVRGKEDPYLRIGDVNDRSVKGTSDYVWALNDINFEVQPGEVLGIIGKNGAGKSTLLKLLSRVTAPTTGKITAHGRIASLLEVGTGFHPELTGRENIFLNGAILGMTKVEIRSKFDEIVDFAGCQRYIDTPVKRYSSGMYVRLAFAVAAHLEPEILVVDEVLAVGDAEFQRKAIGKMKDVSQGEGRTVLFVSHNMGSVKSLCSRGIVLENGKNVFQGTANEAVNIYLNSDVGASSSSYKNTGPLGQSDILEVLLTNSQGSIKQNYRYDESVYLHLRFKIEEELKSKLIIGFRVVDQYERVVFTSELDLAEIYSANRVMHYRVKFPKSFLVPNAYKISVALHIPHVEIIQQLEEVVCFNIEETGSEFLRYRGSNYGCVIVDCDWQEI